MASQPDARPMAVEEIPVPRDSLYGRRVKRILDALIGFFALLVLLPLLGLLCAAEFIFHGRPILYTSVRPGKDEKLFTLYKFRTMTNDRDEAGTLLPEERRLTSFGRFLRRTSLDELPQFVNVLRGDMSLIGPRALLEEYLGLYSRRHRMRHCVRPGFACGRLKGSQGDAWTWADQFESDIWYIENVSFWLDVKIAFDVFIEAIRGSESRTLDTRVRFDGKNLHETRPKNVAQSVGADALAGPGENEGRA